MLGADLVVVAQGPGNLGTGTRWGFSGVAAGEAVNAAAVLGGRPVASLRISEADPRERHRGISHHSLTSYGRVALARADVVVPELAGEFGARVLAAAQPLGGPAQPGPGQRGRARGGAAGHCPVPLSTMGRGLDEDLAYFLAAAAAGRHAGGLVAGAGTRRPATAGAGGLTAAAELGAAAGLGAALTAPDPDLRYELERSCVRVVLQDAGGRVLLFRARLASRSPEHWWELPGGGIEPGESYQQTAVRELAEETGLQVSPDQVGPPRWRRSATWTARGIRRLQHEVVVHVRLDAHEPPVADSGRTAEELEDYTGARWWPVAELLASSERFYPGRLPDLLPAFLAGADLTEPFERWN